MGLIAAGHKMLASELNITTAHYYSTNSTITVAASGGSAVVPYDVTVTTSTDITASGTGNTLFTINRAGLYIVEATSRGNFGTIPTTGSLYTFINKLSASLNLARNSYRAPINNMIIPNVQTMYSFAVNDTIQITLLNNTNQIYSVHNDFAELSHISFTRLQAA